MKYMFILGRNPGLSVLELKSYFKRKEIAVNDIDVRENAVLADIEGTLDARTVDFLGGVISIGIVLCKVKDIDKKEIYMGEKNNFNYALWDFSELEIVDDIRSYLKSRFRKEKLKASEKRLREDIDLQDSKDKGKKLSSKVDEEYFVYGDYFGKIIENCDYKTIEERDMNKPVRRESLSISPRLAKVMINLSEVGDNEILLDGFCGIGVVLTEALSQELKVIGIDKDKKAIEGCKENLNWFKFNKEDYKLINEDSSKVSLKDKFNAMASEPDFGEILRKIPPKEKAEKMTRDFGDLMIRVLNNLKKYSEGRGRFVFTSPYIRISKERIGVDFERISSETGLKIVKGFPVPEYREGQVVGREIVVYER